MPFAASLRGGNRIWGRFGFVDAFCENRNWYARTYLAINQGPIVAMIENHRSALLWNLFMRAPEARLGLARLGFSGLWDDNSSERVDRTTPHSFSPTRPSNGDVTCLAELCW